MIKCMLFLLLWTSVFLLNIKVVRDLQRSKYQINEFNNYFIYHIKIAIPNVALFVLMFFISNKYKELVTIIYLGIVVMLSLYKILNLKVKIKFTKRCIRLLVLSTITNTILTILIVILAAKIYQWYYLLLILNLGIAIFCNGILFPFETINNRKMITHETKILRNSNIIKIGITGSFGKTTIKNILYDLLSLRYNVVKTEGNYNTPLGISLSCKNIKADTQIFIAEMGARRIGDISELVALVNPTIGIISGVNNQHIETFKSQENIILEKSELAKGVKNGTLIINGSNLNSLRIYNESECKNKFLVSLNQTYGVCDIYADEIMVGSTYTKFNLHCENKTYPIKSKLIGVHNITNILLAVKAAIILDVGILNIIKKLETISPPENRMHIIESNGITIIDDSYNANIDGIISGLKVLDAAVGRKIILAQGVVENTKSTNITIGKEIGGVCDLAILIGKNVKSLKNGLNKVSFNKKNIVCYKTLKSAQKSLKNILKKGDTVYIQNDLVD